MTYLNQMYFYNYFNFHNFTNIIMHIHCKNLSQFFMKYRLTYGSTSVNASYLII